MHAECAGDLRLWHPDRDQIDRLPLLLSEAEWSARPVVHLDKRIRGRRSRLHPNWTVGRPKLCGKPGDGGDHDVQLVCFDRLRDARRYA